MPLKISEFIRQVTGQANKQGLKLYLVGGIVRDLILNRPDYDIDLVIEGDAIKFARSLPDDKSHSTVFHSQFGTVKFKFEDFSLDIASARRELYIRPGALPSVSKGTINEDLSRRDFTINALAVKLSYPDPGEIIDPYRGIHDMERKLIRILHDKSFVDDATRILRAIRYEQRLDFHLETNTFKLIQRDIDMLDTLSKDRIKHEFQLFFLEKYPEKSIYRAHQLGVLNKFFPALKYSEAMTKSYQKARKLFKPAHLPLVYMCLLIFHLDSEQLEAFLTKYNFTKPQTSQMRQTVELKNRLRLLGPLSKPWDIFSILSHYDAMIIQINKIAANNYRLTRMLTLYLDKLRYIRPQLTGKDLIALGVQAGPQIGNVLNNLYKARINGVASSRAQEIEIVQRIIKQ